MEIDNNSLLQQALKLR